MSIKKMDGENEPDGEEGFFSVDQECNVEP